MTTYSKIECDKLRDEALQRGPCIIIGWDSGNGYYRVMQPGPNGKRKQPLTHRLMWEKYRGPIPAGMQVDHLCRNTACCNVNHLEVVTAQVNTLRSNGIPAINARKTHCKHGHEFVGYNIKWTNGKRVCRTCANINFKRWADRKRAALKLTEAQT